MDTEATINVTVQPGGVVEATSETGGIVASSIAAGGAGPPGATGPTGPAGPQGPPGTLSIYFDVTAYGAVGDGVTDDTTAIQNAINAAADEGGTVLFPVGVYNISATLTMYTGVSLLGVGSEASEINQTSTTADALDANDCASIGIHGMFIHGPGSGTGTGINFGWTAAGNVPFLNFSDLKVHDFGADGIAIETPIVSSFENVVCQSNGGYGFNFYHAGTSCSFISCWARDNAFAGYHFYESVYISLVGCAADGNGVGYLVENAQSIGFYACGAESQVVGSGDWDGTAFKISNSSVIGLHNVWVTANPAIAIWVTDGSIATEIFGAADNSPAGGATAFVQTDVSTNTTLSDVHNTTANSYSAGTVTVLNDGANGMLTKYIDVKDSSGTMTLSAASDGGQYNVEVDTTGTLAFYGSGGQTLSLNILDGTLSVNSNQVLSNAGVLTNVTLDSAGTGNSLKVNGTGLTAVTGTGSVVLATAPVFTSNATIPTLKGGSGAASTLVIESTSGVGTSDSITIKTGSQVAALTINTNQQATFSGHLVVEGVTSTGATGTGKFVFDTSPTLTTPALGTPSALVLTNATGLPISGITGLGTGIGTWLATPSSANLAAAVTDETGSGALTFATNPTIAVTAGSGSITATGQTAFTLQDSTDATKQAQFIMATIATGTTRDFTFPNAAGTFALANVAQTFSSVQTFSAAPLITVNGAGTNTLTTILTITENSSGTPAAGFGSQILLRLKDSTTTSENAAAINWAWSTATHGSTVSYLQIQTVSGGTTLAEVGRFALSSATVGNLTLGVAGTSDGNLTLSGHTSGATTLIPLAAASGTLTLPSATDTLIGKATTDTLTNKTFDTAGTGNSFSINGVAATANTGTGSVVRATSPTITSLTTSTLLTANTELDLVGSSGTLHFTAASDGGDYNIFSSNGSQVLAIYGSASNTLSLNLLDGSLQIGGTVAIAATGVHMPVQAPTASAPSYVKGGLYFDTTLNKLRVGGATGWETVTSA